MKGWSGFQNSPMKQTQDNNSTLQAERLKRISEIDAKMEALEEDRFNEKITQEEYEKAMKPLRIEEEKNKKPL